MYFLDDKDVYWLDGGCSSEGSLALGLELWRANRCCRVYFLDDKEGFLLGGGSLAFGHELWGANRCCRVYFLDDKEGYWLDGGCSSEGSLAFGLELWGANRFCTVYFFLDDIKEGKEVNQGFRFSFRSCFSPFLETPMAN